MILSHCCRCRVTPNLPKTFVYLIAAISLPFVGGITVADAPKVIEELTGKVVAVTDGDTIKVLVNNATVKVRLEGIDAPEAMQSFGNQSKEALAKLVAGKTVTIRKTGTDKYQRTLGYVMVDGVDANARLVQDGWAWHYKKYNSEQRYADLEDAAQAAKKGLWADANPLQPWEFRARKSSPVQAVDGKTDGEFWLNTSSIVRHNRTCEYFKNTKSGRFCGANEGKPCGQCGG